MTVISRVFALLVARLWHENGGASRARVRRDLRQSRRDVVDELGTAADAAVWVNIARNGPAGPFLETGRSVDRCARSDARRRRLERRDCGIDPGNEVGEWVLPRRPIVRREESDHRLAALSMDLGGMSTRPS